MVSRPTGALSEDDGDARTKPRAGPPIASGPELPERWPRQLAVTVVSPDDQFRGRLATALSSDPRSGYVSPVGVIRQSATCAAAPPARDGEWACFVVDTRTADVREARQGPGAPEGGPWPVLYIDVGQPGDVAVSAGCLRSMTGPRGREYAADSDLRWDETLGAVPLRTGPDDESFVARLRTRVVLLPADVRSAGLYASVTASPDGILPNHAWGGEAWVCPRRAPILPRCIGRGTPTGNALLRCLLRPEAYHNGVGHASLVLPAREAGGVAAGLDSGAPPKKGSAAQRRRSRGQTLAHALRDGGLVSPVRAGHVALVLRARALLAAYGLGIEAVAGLLGYSDLTGCDRPAYSTFYRRLKSLTGHAPGRAEDLIFVDLDEEARRALVRPPAARTTDGPVLAPGAVGAGAAALETLLTNRHPAGRTYAAVRCPGPEHCRGTLLSCESFALEEWRRLGLLDHPETVYTLVRMYAPHLLPESARRNTATPASGADGFAAALRDALLLPRDCQGRVASVVLPPGSELVLDDVFLPVGGEPVAPVRKGDGGAGGDEAAGAEPGSGAEEDLVGRDGGRRAAAPARPPVAGEGPPAGGEGDGIQLVPGPRSAE